VTYDVFSKSAAQQYDEFADGLAPGYRQATAFVGHLVALHAARQRNASYTVFDGGAGTGLVSAEILQCVPASTVIALDNSEEMLGVLRARLIASYPERHHAVRGDLLGDFVAHVRTETDVESFDAVVLTFVLHHFSADERLQVLKRARSLVKDSGILICADLLTFGGNEQPRFTNALADRAQLETEAAITRAFDERVEEEAHDVSKFAGIRDEWMTHVRQEHVLTTVAEERIRLVDSGFSPPEIVFRLWQTTVYFSLPTDFDG